MASLIEELISTLESEENVYTQLIPIAEEKTKAIVDNDMDGLQDISQKELVLIDQVTSFETKRQEVVSNMAVVLNRKVDTLTLQAIVDILQKQPQEQERLRQIHDKLKATVERLKDINAQNKILVEDSLEMIEINLNFIRSTRMSSGSSNYTKDASQTDAPISQPGMFDAKQ